MVSSKPHSVPRTDAPEWVDQINWYVACLEDVSARKVVRGLAEAEAGYDAALDDVQKELARLRGIEEQLEAAQKSGGWAAAEKAARRADALDRFIRETISVWDAKGPLIASEELRERYEVSFPASKYEDPGLTREEIMGDGV